MHDGCQFGIFTNLRVLLGLAVPIREPSAASVSKREQFQRLGWGTSHPEENQLEPAVAIACEPGLAFNEGDEKRLRRT